MDSSIGVNMKKQFNSMMRNTKVPKRKRTTNESIPINMEFIKANSYKAKNMASGFANMLKQGMNSMKSSMQGSLQYDGNDLKISYNNHQYTMKKQTLAMGAGFLAASALSAYVASKIASNRY